MSAPPSYAEANQPPPPGFVPNQPYGYGQGQYPPPQQQGYGAAPPQQQGYGAAPPQAQAGYGGNYPPQGGYPPQQGYGAPQQGYGAPPQGYGAPPPAAAYDQPTTGYAPQPAMNTENESGYKPDDDGTFGSSFGEKAIRHAFIKKVYLILTAQLLVTIGFIAFFMFYRPMQMWVWQNSWFYYLSYATFLVTYITLVCCPSVRRKSPGNYICMLVFTLAFSYMTATITSFYDTEIVLIAAGITAAVTLSITLFAIQTRIDFTMCTGLLFALSMVVFFFGFACIIVYATIGPNYILHCVYGALAALLFSLFLAYDTQMLIGGRKHQLSPEEYIFGALQLYLDVVYIFLIILSCFGGKSN